MAKTIIVIKVEPIMRKIVRMPIKPSLIGIRNLLNSSKISARILLDDVNGEALIVGSRINVDPVHPFKEWRLRGGDNTVGVGVLFGTFTIRTEQQSREWGRPIGARIAEGMWHCPVDVAWVERRIVWCEPGEDAPAAEIAEAMDLEDPNA